MHALFEIEIFEIIDSAPRYLFNDTKVIRIVALVEKWQVKQKLVHT